MDSDTSPIAIGCGFASLRSLRRKHAERKRRTAWRGSPEHHSGGTVSLVDTLGCVLQWWVC